MCGIFGFSIPKESVTPGERILLAAMLGTLNDDRGGDSWGAYLLNGEVQVMRGLGKAGPGMAWAKVIPDAEVMMGHTRKATTGAISLGNAHPFEVGNIVGAHNGFVTNYSELNKKYSRSFEVDSPHIFAHIQKGWRLTELTGWGAIEYTNKKKWPKRVNLCKVSSGGDLSIAAIDGVVDAGVIKNTNGIAWSSTTRHLEQALDIAGLKGRYTLYQVDTGSIYSVEGGKLIKQARKHLLGTTSYGTATYSSGSYSGHYGGNGTSFRGRDSWDGDVGDEPATEINDLACYFRNGAKFYVNRKLIKEACDQDRGSDPMALLAPPPGEPVPEPAPDPITSETEQANEAIIEQLTEQDLMG